MAIRKKLKTIKGWIKEKTRPSARTSPTQSTHSLPTDVTDATLISNPTPGLLAIPTGAAHISRPSSAPPGDVPKPSDNAWTCLRGFVQVLSKGSSILGPLRIAMDDLSRCFAIYEDAAMAQQDYQALKTELEGLFITLSSHFAGDVPPTMTASMNSLCSAIERELDRMSIKEARGTGRRYLEANKDLDEVMACYRRVQGHLERLNLNADLSTWKIVDKLATDAALKELKPSMSACYNSAEASLVRRRECTPETRKQVLAELTGWRHNREQSNIYWLNGMAGTGKTTIATTLCAMLERTHDLGASFFCSRQLPECRNVKLILPTIAYQLACFSRPFRCALARALESDPNLHTKALPIQLEGMIVAPLREVAHTLPSDLVVVIDALDECDDSNGVAQILGLLVQHASNLPIKIFVSSRPEPQIRQMIGSMKSQLVLHELDNKIVQGDIERYLRTEFEGISVSQSQLAGLVGRAGVLFIYAATVVRYIKAKGFHAGQQERLDQVLNASSMASAGNNKEIDALYDIVLSAAFNGSDLEEPDKERMRLVLHTVLCAQEPLTVSALARLLNLGDGVWVRDALGPLWSVLHVSESGTDPLVTTLHASFPDYMLDPGRSKAHGCNPQEHHGRLFELCLARVQNNGRQFNICELESSYVFDEIVPDLEERIDRAIPLDLTYACRYWALHLERGGPSGERVKLLNEFLSTRLLLWMEVLNLKKRIYIGPTLLQKARKWCMDQDDASITKDLIHDAWRFVSTFAGNPVSRSTPQIYVSMLASWPRSRPVAEWYVPRTKQLVEVAGTAMTRRELDLLGVFTTDGVANSITFSSDATRIVTGSWGGGVRVYDAQSGQAVLGPLEGHTGLVSSVVFSPDDTRIVSGSYDMTVRLWDAQSGQLALGPFEGHTEGVTSVAFSPNNIHIASGSSDKTIWVWDTQSGQAAWGPLEGHTDGISSVAFSPDGMHIVSTGGQAIRVWDVKSGQTVLGLLQEEMDSVYGAVFSPDGMRIISGSSNLIRVWDIQSGQTVLEINQSFRSSFSPSTKLFALSPDGTHVIAGSADHTIQVWHALSGEIVLGPFRGINSNISSIAFSPDGTRIVSGSWDHKIRVWDAQNAQMTPELLTGHTGSVSSVAFSPNGMSIASGSIDNNVWVWGAQSGQMVLGPLEGHTDWVNSVAFSPDGLRIASCSCDRTIRVWDSRSGKVVLGPLEGHTGLVTSVAFSPDGMHVVSGSSANTRQLMGDTWAGGSRLFSPRENTPTDYVVAFSPDSMHIVSGFRDHTILVWDAQSGQVVLGPLEEPTGQVTSVASPESMHIASSSVDSTIRMWDAQGVRIVPGTLERDRVCSVALSPHGTYIASGSDDMAIRVWDVQSGQMVLGPLEGHTGWVTSVAFSPDGMNIVSGSRDQTIRCWYMPDILTAAYQRADQMASTPALQAPPSATSAHPLASSPTSCASLQWELDGDGWVRDAHDRILLWIPHDLRDRLLRPLNRFLISTRGSVQLTFDRANIGESWVKCYSPVQHQSSYPAS